MNERVTLYIATHKKGLKYFGKSKKCHDLDSLMKYGGSGKYWLRYLNKHGKDITMEILGTYPKEEVKEIALKFSKDNNIVESKEWANLKDEDGLEGGWKKGMTTVYDNIEKRNRQVTVDEYNKYKDVRYIHINRFREISDETRTKISERVKGEGNPMYNKNHTDETKKVISQKNKGKPSPTKGKPMSEETKQKLRVPKSEEHKQKLRGPKSEEHIRKLRLIAKDPKRNAKILQTRRENGNDKVSEETKKKLSVSAKNRPKVICPHCGKEGDKANMIRWHYDNCKNKGQ